MNFAHLNIDAILSESFTSVAFAHSASPDEVKLVQTWPKGSTGSNSSDQVPTELTYTDPANRKFCWGYEASRAGGIRVEPLKWFKLLLQPSDQGTVSSDHKSDDF